MGTITTRDNVTIYYKDWGAGQPVVLSHGWPLSADSWESQALFLAANGFRVITHINLWRGDNVLAIPVGALFRDGSDWATYVVQDGRARLKTITLGERNDSFAQVLSGVQAGDAVILHPSDLVTDGTAVARLPAPAE